MGFELIWKSAQVTGDEYCPLFNIIEPLSDIPIVYTK